MQVEISVTLAAELIAAVDELAGATGNRSNFIGAARRAYLAGRIRDERDRRDLAIINRRARRLNREAEETRAYQSDGS